MIQHQTKKAFTLVELIVVITILAILWTIAFLAFEWYSKDSRDTARITDINNIEKNLEIFALEKGKYPVPSVPFSVTYSWATVWNQWTFWKSVMENVWWFSKLPVDPLTWDEYTYSAVENRSEYEVATIFEWDPYS